MGESLGVFAYPLMLVLAALCCALCGGARVNTGVNREIICEQERARFPVGLAGEIAPTPPPGGGDPYGNLTVLYRRNLAITLL